MALKDLVAQRSALAEEAIEGIISDFVRFDPAEKIVAFTPDADGLSNRAKVLVYLVALQGWPFVTDEPIPVDAKPSEIEEHVGVQGGSLRPILKELKDSHVIAERGGRYFVRAMSLSAIKAHLANSGGALAGKLKQRVRRGKAPKQSSEEQVAAAPAATAGKGGKRLRRRSTTGLAERFERWIDEGFFDTPRVLAEVKGRFHKEGIIVPSSSIPKYLLKALRAGRLERDKQMFGDREVWVYQRGKKKK
jgi:hypothetical protein